ncbi:TonB-dependent receptor domain-containing protein [uncultured Hymenobacter sp.]|uniref:TonB-dependent receptor n=1 Tax=uncultured Hymenobacter sp. TaxID=170016 RepID=UPI0035C96CC7
MAPRSYPFAWLLAGILLPQADLLAQTTLARSARTAAGAATLRGTLTDAAGEPLIGATVFVQRLALGTTADAQGRFVLALPPGPHLVTYSFIGYEPQTENLTLASGPLTRNVQLAAASVSTAEVIVTARRAEDNVQSTETGVTRLDMKTIKLVPALLGEVDVIRTILLLPGVSTVGEGAAGFNVRGGGIDQNLVLLDDAPVMSSSHLFGLFSIFNPDAVSDLKLVKGGLPAQYGGRLSSLLDVRLKNGNAEKLSGSGGIGSVSSRFALDGPISKGKSSFVLAGRRSYADVLLKLVPEQRDNAAYFYDLTGKASFTLSPRDGLYLSGYVGRDVFNFGTSFLSDFGNTLGTVRWSHAFSPRLSMNVTALASQYDYHLGVPTGTTGFDWKSNILNRTGKVDFTYQRPAGSTLSFGVSGTRYTVQPGQVTPTDPASIFQPLIRPDQRAAEYAAYFDQEQTLSPRLAVQYGLRLSVFDYLGAGSVARYAGPDGVQKAVVGEQTYGKGDLIKRYANLEPRASLRYTLNEASSLKASYTRTVQNLHLLSNTTASSPLDVWSPSTNNIRPEHADQVAMGYFRNLHDNDYEASVEVYGKTLDNQIDYINGANVLLNAQLEADLLYGRGRAYGAEFYLKKNKGPFTGWVSYTLSRAERQINGLNNNDWYVAKYDKPHNLSVVGSYALSPRLALSGAFTYSTGIATTMPDSRFEYQGLLVPNVNGDVRNNYRVPAYHRLDLSATLQQRRNEARRWQGEWVFSLYNAYGRRNAYSIYLRQNEDNARQTEAVRLSVFGTVLPSVTYNFKF